MSVKDSVREKKILKVSWKRVKETEWQMHIQLGSITLLLWQGEGPAPENGCAELLQGWGGSRHCTEGSSGILKKCTISSKLLKNVHVFCLQISSVYLFLTTLIAIIREQGEQPMVAQQVKPVKFD